MPLTLPPSRRIELRNYLLAICRDLAERGLIRWAKGQSLEAILRQEGPKIIAEMKSDFSSVLAEIGVGLAGGIATKLQASAVEWLTGKMAGTTRKSR